MSILIGHNLILIGLLFMVPGFGLGLFVFKYIYKILLNMDPKKDKRHFGTEWAVKILPKPRIIFSSLLAQKIRNLVISYLKISYFIRYENQRKVHVYYKSGREVAINVEYLIDLYEKQVFFNWCENV